MKEFSSNNLRALLDWNVLVSNFMFLLVDDDFLVNFDQRLILRAGLFVIVALRSP